MRALPLLATVSMLVCCVGAAAQNRPEGNAQAGRQIALRSCASCHLVAANQEVPPIPNYGPRFSDIAGRPGVTAETLQAFLSNPPAMTKMPHPHLTPTEMADVIAYLLSLRSQR